MALSSVLAGIAEGLTQVGFGIYDRYNQNKWAERNQELQREAMAQTQFNFENQAQIRSLDYQKAGLSPLAMNGTQGQSVTASPSAPSSSAAPLLGIAQIISDHQMQNKQIKADLQLQREQLRHEEKMQAEQLASTWSISEASRVQQESQFTRNLAQDFSKWSAELTEKQREFNIEQSLKKRLADIAEREVSAQETRNIIEEAKKNNEWTIAQQKIDQANKELAQAKSEKEKDQALKKREQNMNLLGEILTSVIHSLGFFAGSLFRSGGSGSKNPIGFRP